LSTIEVELEKASGSGRGDIMRSVYEYNVV
jgi:hypothetical protein